jgi:hypothetical protein
MVRIPGTGITRLATLAVGAVTMIGALALPAPAADAATSALGPGAGVWTSSTVPMPPDADANNKDLTGISCSSTTQCAAVGNYFSLDLSATAPAVLNLSGTTWAAHRAPTPDPLVPDESNQVALAGVSCPAADRCFAAGNQNTVSQEGILLGWDGSSWSAEYAPVPADAQPGDPQAFLHNVSCATSSWCVAVGQYADDSGNMRGLLDTWNGQAWTASAAPAPPGVTYLGGVVAVLNAVSCASPGACVAGGLIQDQLGRYQPYVVRLSAGTWDPVQVSLPADASQGPGPYPLAIIYGVSCAMRVQCVAVGIYYDSSGNQQGLLLIRRGAGWQAIKAPVPADAASNPFLQLNAVSCPTPGVCYVAGSYETPAGPQGLILSGIGNSWKPAASLTSTYSLTGISCLLPLRCLAVGGQSYSDPILVTGP